MIANLKQLALRTPYSVVPLVVAWLENHAIEAISYTECEDAPPSSEVDENGFPIAAEFLITGYTRHSIDEIAMGVELSLLTRVWGVPPLNLIITGVAEEDWAHKAAASFKPLSAGVFFVHANKEPVPAGQIGIHIRAATAFGSGEHATTQGCLRGISLSQGQNLRRCLDMGCGSGILAIAMKKCFPGAEVIAVDNDPESVRVTRENAQLNGVALEVIESEGFANARINTKGPYAMITANILAKPLCLMARDMERVTQSGSVVILAGLLENQAPQVLESYSARFTLEERVINEGWAILVLRRQ
jgi:ribosomal protein L11 methyltransferase